MKADNMAVIFHPAAVQEFLRSRRWYAKRDLRVEQRFAEAVNDAIARAEAAPESHPVFRGQFREVRVRRFPFAIYFRLENAAGNPSIAVYAVAHTSRRAGYWVRRRSPGE
uniref:Type II toxin-antitoxin system RelE/ParE family toxin n=1 Tax=Schlesneria paludicola TaxID=360056 RepID=A0A7C2NUV1_9PLAN